MDRTPSRANGSSIKPKIITTAISSPVRRAVPVSNSSKFPPIKKIKKTSPRKPIRTRINGKVSLPKVSSVTFSSGNVIQEVDTGEELEVLKCILVREGYLQRLGRVSCVGQVTGAHLGETVDVLDLLRLATLETVEAIVAWRNYKQKNEANVKLGDKVSNEPEQFKWNGINYLLKLASDVEFLGKYTGLTDWLGFTLLRNPFILPLNLDCRAKLMIEEQPRDRIDTADSNRFLQVGGKRAHRDNLRDWNGDIEKRATDTEVLAQILAERRRAKTPYETRVINDEELVPNSPSKIGVVPPKTRAPLRITRTKYSSVLPSQIGEVDMARLHEAENVVLQEEAVFGRYARDIHDRIVPEDEAQRRFTMVDLSSNAYNVPATLLSDYTAKDPEGYEMQLGNPSQSDVPGKLHAKKRSGMLGPISKPEWRSFDRPPPPRRRARGAQLEEALAAERKANARLGVLLDTLREEIECKAMDIAYFESCIELEVYNEELHTFTTRAQRELEVLRQELQEKRNIYESKIIHIQKKEELLNIFKAQHKAIKDTEHVKRIEHSREQVTKVSSLNQEQQRREDQEQAAARAVAAAELHKHDLSTPIVQHFCATQIQKVVRGMLAREIYAQMKIEFTVASTFIQASVRGFLVRRRVAKMYWQNVASVHLQRAARGWLGRRRTMAIRRKRMQIQAAERIQKVVRGRFGRVRMLKIRKLVSWRLHLALAARSIDAVALQELANACQAMVALPNLMKAEIKTESEEKPLPALVLGLVRVLMLFLSDDDDEWDIPNTRWCEATRFLRCGVGVTRRMQKIADAAAGAARAWMSPSGRFAAPGVAASTPYLRESVLGTGLMDAYAGDLNFRVETFERIPRGWRAAVAIFKWTTAFCAITRLQHLLEPSRTGTDPFLVVHHTLSKREAQHEITERRDAAHNDEVRARRFVPTELVQARNYPFHRPRPLLLVVANDVPPKARMVILEKLQAALPGLFLTITRPVLLKKRSLRDDTTQTFDSTKIRDALALGHCVILESDVGLRDVTQRAFVSSFAAVKHGLHPTPMCVLLRGNIKNRSDLFGPEQGSDIEEKVYREGIERRMVDADIKVALDRTTRLRLELAEDAITREMVEQAKTGDGVPTPSPALVIVMEAVIVLLTPGKVYEGPSQGDIATSAVSWRLSRRLLAQPSFLRAKLQQVDVTTIPSINLVALERYLHHSLWPNAIVSRSQVVSNRLLYALAVWVESATKAARLIASDGTGTLAPEITRFGPVSGLFERVVVFDNCPIDHNQVGAGENLAVMQLMDAVLADVRVYRTANVLVRSNMNASSKSRKQKPIDEERCVVTLFHECRRIFACVYSPSSGQRWITVISEDDIDHLLTPTAMPCGGESLADKLPPKTHTEMYARLARLCLLQKRRIEDCPETIEPPSPYELVLRPRSIRLYRHVLQLGGYLVTVTIAEQSRGHVQVDAFVHSSNSQSSFAEAVTLTLAVELENILGRLSAAQARSVFVPASRIPSIVLDRLRLYCATRTRMLEPEFQPKLMPSMRLNVRTGENASGRLLLRRAVRVSRNNGVTPGERLVFTLFECHEDGNFLATFYSPRSSTRHTIRLSSSAVEELLHVSRHAPPSRLHQILVRTFSIACPTPKDNEHDSEGSDANINRTSEEEADTRICYRLRRRILARFPCALLVMEDPHQRVTKKQVKRAYVQVELCDQEPEGEHNIQTATGKKNTNTVRYRVTLAESCLEQTLLLQECEIEASIPVEYSWSRASCSDRKSFSRDIVRRYFQWDPNGGSGENGSVVAHLPCGSFWATEVKTTSMLGNSARNHIDQAAKEEQAGYITRPRTKQTITDSEVSVVSCTYLLDDRDTESDDELEEDDFKGIKRRTYSYDTDELIHRGSYHANGLYVVIRVSMRAVVLRDLQPVLVSPTDRVRERDSFAITFHVYHPASSGTAIAEIHGRRDLREVVGPDQPHLITVASLDSLMRHIILLRLDIQVDGKNDLKATFLRDRLYAKQKATPVTKTFERDSSVNAAKLINESRHHGVSGERGVKVLTATKVLPTCGRTLLTVFDVAGKHRQGSVEELENSLVMLRVDAYICSTSARLSLLLEGSDLVHIVGEEDKGLLLPISDNDANSTEVVELEKKRSIKLAQMVLGHLRVEQRSDGRGDRLVLSNYSYFMTDKTIGSVKSKMLFKTIRAVGHCQILLSAFLDEDCEFNAQSLRLVLYDPASSSRCTLKLSHSTLRNILGLPESMQLLDFFNDANQDHTSLMMHLCSFVHIEKMSAITDGVEDKSSMFTMKLLFDEERGCDCLKEHFNENGSSAEETSHPSWTGVTRNKHGYYLSVHLRLLHNQTPSVQKSQCCLVCSAFAPAELLVNTKKFEWADIPAELFALLPDLTTYDQLAFTPFFTKVCEQLHLELQFTNHENDDQAVGPATIEINFS